MANNVPKLIGIIFFHDLAINGGYGESKTWSAAKLSINYRIERYTIALLYSQFILLKEHYSVN